MTTTKSKIALVTGGSRGLGRNMALSLAKKGIDVILTYHSNQQKAEEVVAEIQALGQKAMAFQLDAGNIQLFDGFFKQLIERLEEQNSSPKIDFIINNADRKSTRLNSSN